MNVYKHTAVSLATGALLMVIFRKVQMSVACFLSGTLIDLDHIFDYLMNHEMREKLGYLRHPRKLSDFLVTYYTITKPESKVYKLLHGMELLILVPILYVSGLWNAAATGITVGFVIHLLMDFLPLGHIGTVSLIYKVIKGFPRGADILKQRLSRLGMDIHKCQSCGVYGETLLRKDGIWYAGFTRRGLSKLMIVCQDCYDRMKNEEDR